MMFKSDHKSDESIICKYLCKRSLRLEIYVDLGEPRDSTHIIQHKSVRNIPFFLKY
jgi:hypothetical protein